MASLGMLGAIAGLGSGLESTGKWMMEKNREEERDNRMAQRQQELEAKRQAWQEKELERRLDHETKQRGLDRDQRQQQIDNEKEQQDRTYVLNLAKHQLDADRLASDAEYRNRTLDNEGRRIDILGRQADLAEKNGNLTDLQKEQLRGLREQMVAVQKSMLSEMATPESITRGRQEMNLLQRQLHEVVGIKARIADDPRAPAGENSDEPKDEPRRRPRAGDSSAKVEPPPAERRPDTSRPPSMGGMLGQKVSQPDREPDREPAPEPNVKGRDQLLKLQQAGEQAMEALSLKGSNFDKAMELALKVRNSPYYGELNEMVRKQIAELASGRGRK